MQNSMASFVPLRMLLPSLIIFTACDTKRDLNHVSVASESKGKTMRNGASKDTLSSGTDISVGYANNLNDINVVSKSLLDNVNEIQKTGKNLTSEDLAALHSSFSALETSEYVKATSIANEASKRLPSHVIAAELSQKFIDVRRDFESTAAPVLRGFLVSQLDNSIKNELIKTLTGNAGDHTDIIKDVIGISLESYSIDQKTLAQSFRNLALTNQQEAVDYLISKEWSSDFELSASIVFSTYALENQEMASVQVNQLKGTPAYQWAAAGLYQVIKVTEPESARIWRQEITDPRAADRADALTYLPKD